MDSLNFLSMRLIVTLFFLISFSSFAQEKVYLRVNQLGYLPGEPKVAVLFSKAAVSQKVNLLRVADMSLVKSFKPKKVTHGNWGVFEHYYEIDFSKVTQEGKYYLETSKTKERSVTFDIKSTAYDGYSETLLTFMRQQRCGYNPTLDVYCHQKDGYSFYGPMADTTFVDASGGWHDAGDQLKYLITSSYATAHMLKTYELYPDKFKDLVDAAGKPGANGIPDILDEAKWGLDWMLKLHPSPNALIHQVADDRDHAGYKMPDNDNSDYGWGANSYRTAYFADGKPQGLGKFKSAATGVSNLAGRSAAAFAIAARIWKYDAAFAERCREAALSLYALGKEKEGYQQGNSVKAPYRYNEDTFNDDMEWGAAEMYLLTKDENYLTQAKYYALKSNTVDSWTVKDTADHYRLYPFLNMGHFVLHGLVDNDFKKTLEGYYLEGIKYTQARANRNPFRIGVPFIWCSNNLATSLAGQIILYQKMTNSKAYDAFLVSQRDWLFGKNPWGTSMFSGIPEWGKNPKEVHTSLYALKGLEIPGGLVDGPVYASIYNNLIGIQLVHPDEFAEVQNTFVVYHDDLGDYSSNEPTMDGTAGSLLMMAHFSKN
jgi:endoglucanase